MSSATLSFTPSAPVARWRDVVLPKEHGSWSLALEPIGLGLLIAPSSAGACLAVAVLGGFFARRPLKIALRDREAARRAAATRALAGCAILAAGGIAGAMSSGGVEWLGWLLPFAVLGGVFLGFDLQNSGREELAEIVGAAAFAGVSGAIVAAGGQSSLAAAAALLAMASRAVPTVLFVRACVRGRKAGELRLGVALWAAGAALLVGLGLAGWRLAPWTLAIALAVLLARAFAPLFRSTPIRARTLGFQELAFGIAYVGAVGTAWHLQTVNL